MSSLFGTPRRGLRAVVRRGPIIDGRLDLFLECGHSISRNHSSRHRPSAVCPTCAKTDGAARDDERKGAA